MAGKLKRLTSAVFAYALVYSGLAMAQTPQRDDALNLTKDTAETIGIAAVILVGTIYFGFIAAWIFIAGFNAAKAFKVAKQEQTGDPTVAGIKAFAGWSVVFVILGMLLTYGINYWLQGQLRTLITKIIGLQ